MKKAILLIILVLTLMVCATTLEQRQFGDTFPVARYEFAQQSWATGAGHASAAPTLANVNGYIERIDVLVSSVTADPNVDVTLTDHNTCQLASFTNLDDGTKHVKLATSDATDFDALPVCGTLTATIDPSADAGGTGQTLTVDVILYLR